MAKVTNPLHSDSASGRVGQFLTYSKRKNCQIARMQRNQKDVVTPARTSWRANFIRACNEWKALTQEQKNVYNSRVIGRPLTGFNLYVSENIWLPPALYSYLLTENSEKLLQQNSSSIII